MIFGFDRKRIKKIAVYTGLAALGVSFFLVLFLTYAYFYEIPRMAMIEALPGFLRDGIDGVRGLPYFFYRFKSSGLPQCDLFISETNYREIISALPKSASEILSEETKISEPAKFVCGGNEWDVRVGVRGDKFYHWFYEKKSWNIKFPELFEGNSEIKLIVPNDRGYVAEYFNSYRAKKLGLKTPEDKFISVKLNNGPDSLYYQMEGWTKDFIQKHFGTDSGNLYGEIGVADPIFDSVSYWKKYVSVSGQENDFSDLVYLFDLVNRADDETFKKEIWDVLNKDNFYNWQIHSMLSGSPHQSFSHNIRLFYDKEKGKFFFIPWNVGIEDYSSYFDFSVFGKTVYDLDLNYNPLVSRVLNIPEFLFERNKRLWNYLGNENNLENDLTFFDETFEKIKPALFNDPIKFWRSAVADKDIKNRRQWLISDFNFLRDQLDKAEFSAIISRQENSHVPLVIDLRYVSASPLELKGFVIEFIEAPQSGPAVFNLYEDINNNGQWDSNDLKIGDLIYRDNSVFSDKINRLFYSDREAKDFLAPISLKPTNKKLFIASSRPMNITGSSAVFDISNSVTRTKIVPKAQFAGEARILK